MTITSAAPPVWRQDRPAPPPRPAPLWVKVIAVLVAIPTILFALLAAAGAAAFIDGLTADRTTHLTAPLAAGGTVDVELNSGGVVIEAGPDGQVTVDDRLSVRAPTRDLARRALDNFSVSREATAGTGVVVTVPSAVYGFATSVNREITIHVPTGARMIVHGTNAGARLLGLSGPLQVEVDSGGVDLQNIVVTSSDSVSISNGAVNFKGRINGGTLDVAARNGAVNILVPPDTNATYALTSHFGAINVERPDGPSHSTSGLQRTLSGNLGAGTGASITVRTTNGAINLDARG